MIVFNITKESLFFLALIFIAVTLPFSNLLVNTISIWFMIATWIFVNPIKQKIQILRSNKLIWLFSFLFIIYVIGLIYGDFKSGIFELEKRLSLIIFPIVLGTIPEISPRKIKIVLLSFSVSCILISLICLIHTFYTNYSQGIVFFSDQFYTDYSYGVIYSYNNSWLFSNEHLTKNYGFHPSYFSIYAIFSIFILFHTLFENKKHNILTKLFLILAIVYLLIFNFFLASRIGIVSLLILLIGGILFFSYKKHKLLAGIIVTIVFIFITSLVLQLFPPIKEKFKSLITSNSQNFQFSGGSGRFELWESTFEVIDENLFLGIGTGDLQPALQKKYESKKFVIPARYHYNPHNQFLDITGTLGIIGLMVFLVCLFYSFFISYKTKNYIYLTFIVLFIFISFVECTLAVQKGVVWFAFFNSLFAFHSQKTLK